MKILGLIVYTIVIWCLSGNCWYENGYKDGFKRGLQKGKESK